MSEKTKLNDAEFTLMTVFLLLGFFGTLGFGGSFFLAVFVAILALFISAIIVSEARKAKR